MRERRRIYILYVGAEGLEDQQIKEKKNFLKAIFYFSHFNKHLMYTTHALIYGMLQDSLQNRNNCNPLFSPVIVCPTKTSP